MLLTGGIVILTIKIRNRIVIVTYKHFIERFAAKLCIRLANFVVDCFSYGLDELVIIKGKKKEVLSVKQPLGNWS